MKNSIFIGILLSTLLLIAKINFTADKEKINYSNQILEVPCTTENESEDELHNYDDIYTCYSFIPLERGLQVSIKQLCDKYSFSYDMMLAIIMNESAFQENIVSEDGHDFGLCQIRDTYWEDTAKDNKLNNWKINSYENVELALIILTQCREMADGDLENMLKYYNLGEIKDFPVYEDGTTYYERVTNNYNWILTHK